MNDLRITKMMMNEKKYPLKSPYKMQPKGIVIHNTYNNASAINEISYMIGNNNAVSFHYAVDDTRAVQGIPLNRNAWHCGNRQGNLNMIGIEIARSTSDLKTYLQAQENGAKLCAILCKQFGWTTKDIYTHQNYSGKYCPHRMLDLKHWQDGTFKKLVQKYINNDTNVEQGGADTDMDKIGDRAVAIISLTPNGAIKDMASAIVIKNWLSPSYNGAIMISGTDTFEKVNTNYIIGIGGNPKHHSYMINYHIGGKNAEETYQQALDFVRNGDKGREKYKIKK